MHNNYYFLKHLSKSISNKIVNSTVIEVFTQNKKEAIFLFQNNLDRFIIKADLNQRFSSLSFPFEFIRAKKNTFNLFTEIINLKVLDVVQHKNERAFSIILTNDYQLIFKLFGNQSNILLSKNNKILSLFNNKIEKDFMINTKNLDRNLDDSFRNFKTNQGNVLSTFPTFGKKIYDYLRTKNYGIFSLEKKWELINDTLVTLSKGLFFYNEKELTLIPNNKMEYSDDPLIALNGFYLAHIKHLHLTSTKKKVLEKINNNIKKNNSYVNKANKRLKEISNNNVYKKYADIIMANLEKIKTNSEKTQLSNFFNNNMIITIPLKKNLTPQKNAENYYRKAKKQSIEERILSDNIQNKKSVTDILLTVKEKIEKTDSIRILKKIITDNNLLDNKKKIKDTSSNFKTFSFEGFSIWVGKNASSNDKLLKLAHKNDFWLHAKDVSGSHVIIKHGSNKNVSKKVKERAAELAAFYSKRKNEKICPVIITLKKYVRNPKGGFPGQVVIDKENIILITPKK